MLGGAPGSGSPGAQLRAGGEPDVTDQPQRRDKIQLCGGRVMARGLCPHSDAQRPGRGEDTQGSS